MELTQDKIERTFFEKYHAHALCQVCFQPFTFEEWENRHSTEEGEDCHEQCCPECNMGEKE